MTSTTQPASAPAAPDSVAAHLAAARAHLSALDEADLQALPSPALLEMVDAIEALDRQLQALTARTLTAAETDGLWATTGARSFAAWYRARTGRHHARAGKAVTTARRLRDHLPATAAALAAGHISADHVAALTTHAAATPAARAQLKDPDLGEHFLLGHARSLGATEFTHLVRHWADRADPAAADRTFRDETDKEHLTLAPTTDGYHLSGWLTTTNGQALQEALDARTGTPSASDTRTPGQRRAASLSSLARLVLDSGILRPGARIRPHLSVHVPHDTLTRLIDASRTHHPRCAVNGTASGTCTNAPSGSSIATSTSTGTGPSSRTGTSAATSTPACTCPGHPDRTAEPPGRGEDFLIPGTLDHHTLAGAESATLADGTPIAPSLLARLACGSAFRRIIFGPDSEILDVGREERLFTAAQTAAIIARDRTCRYPDCHAPPGEGEIHHSLAWYDHYGDTAAHLGVLLCWAHHDYVHARHITIDRTGDRWSFTRPDGTTITSIRTNPS